MKKTRPNQNLLNDELTRFMQELQDGEITYGSQRKITYEEFLSNRMMIIAAIRAGIPYNLFNLIQKNTPFTENDWASYLGISTKSMQRYRHQSAKHHFKPMHSEKIIELAEVTKAGLDVFENMETLKLWLHTPNYALGKMQPIELLKDSYGKEWVLAELTRINHGILA